MAAGDTIATLIFTRVQLIIPDDAIRAHDACSVLTTSFICAFLSFDWRRRRRKLYAARVEQRFEMAIVDCVRSLEYQTAMMLMSHHLFFRLGSSTMCGAYSSFSQWINRSNVHICALYLVPLHVNRPCVVICCVAVPRVSDFHQINYQFVSFLATRRLICMRVFDFDAKLNTACGARTRSQNTFFRHHKMTIYINGAVMHRTCTLGV